MRPRRKRVRRGLAPLELVLGLPFLMCVMALIVNVGTGAKWKLLGLAAVRQAAWSQRADRKAFPVVRPAGWPDAALYESVPAGNDLFPKDPFANYPVVRGAVLQNPKDPTASLQVDQRKLDVKAGMIRGHVKLDRTSPMLPQFSAMRYELQHLLAESRWRFQDMGYSTNETRRTTLLYSLLEKVDSSAFHAAAVRIFPTDSGAPGATIRTALQPLDRDAEFKWWPRSPFFVSTGHGSCSCLGTNGNSRWTKTRGPSQAYDFYPALTVCCTADVNASVGCLIELIEGTRGDGKGGLPSLMANAFRALYETILQDERNGNPPVEASLPPAPEGNDWQGKLNNLAGFP